MSDAFLVETCLASQHLQRTHWHHQGAEPQLTFYLEAAGKIKTHRLVLHLFFFRPVKTRFGAQLVHICFQVIILQWNIQNICYQQAYVYSKRMPS